MKMSQIIHRRVRLSFIVIALAGLLSVPALAPAAASRKVLVFAAASTTDALGKAGKVFEQQHPNIDIVFSFASSGTLARQIEHGADADVYVSANIKWMDYLQKLGKIRNASRTNLLTNQLVLVAPADSTITPVKMVPGFPLATLLGDGYLAMGNPSSVPAGMYGKQALTALRVWKSVQTHVARSANVRAALALVATGAAPLGVVYRTDAIAADNVKIIGTFPDRSHTPIVYPVALTRASNDTAATQAFLRFLHSDTAADIFHDYGFTSAK